MAAYAALVSVMHTIDQLQLHPRPPISLQPKQVESLTEKVTFLQEFLEGYNPHLRYSAEADPFERRIADAAHAAEDAIESHIVDQITNYGNKNSLGGLYRSLKMVITKHGKVSSNDLHEALEKVIQEMAVIEKEAVEIKQTVGVQHDQLQRNSMPLDSLRPSSIEKKCNMVGADDILLEIKEKLTSHSYNLQIIPIVGMGGSGKTTLAINIYQDPLIKEHFYTCAWATISQEYSIREILIEVLSQMIEDVDKRLSEDKLGLKLYQHLFGRKYLIILDDIWSIEAWDGVKNFLPDNNNGSRVVVTSRLSNLASKLSNSNSIEMKLLDEATSWNLLSKTVFGEKGCPPELERIGRRIGRSCKGLPLSIAVVGGLLAKSKHTREFWEYIEENINSIVNLEDDERCLKILHMSYKQLPIYLKPCFLYMGVFPEGEVIRISTLIKLWVNEGFLKPVSGKSLEEIARVYLKDLIDRNLILIYQMGSIGNIKYCKIHNLLRDMCLREVEKERFYIVVARLATPQGTVTRQRRIVNSSTTLTNKAIKALSSVSLARSLIWMLNGNGKLPPLSFRLLRIFYTTGFIPIAHANFLEKLVNSRCLALSVSRFHSSIWLFWNLQTLIVDHPCDFTAPTDIWYMPCIRHIQFDFLYLPDPPNCQDDIVLRNLQTLVRIVNFKCSEQVVKRIPNVKKLKILYYDRGGYCLNNLDCLDKLESFTCAFYQGTNPNEPDSLESLTFPHSLKKLVLDVNPFQCWENLLDKVSMLPLLQKLTLTCGGFKKGQWKTIEGQFRSLKFLAVRWCPGLQVWTIESSHFPCLDHLRLDILHELKEIPLDFAEVSTLRVIEVEECSDSIVVSAKRILEEQEELYGEAALQVRVTLSGNNQVALNSLASPNFHVYKPELR